LQRSVSITGSAASWVRLVGMAMVVAPFLSEIGTVAGCLRW
jgi:hypothetical protein